MDYFEQQAREFFKRVSSKGDRIREFYNKIWKNYLLVVGELKSVEPYLSKPSIENFLKLTKVTGDYYEIMLTLDNFERLIKQIKEKGIEKRLEIYYDAVLTNIIILRSLVGSGAVYPCYVILRNLIENVVKSIVYHRLAKNLKADFLPTFMFFYEQQCERRTKTYNLKEYFRKSVGKFMKIKENLGNVYYENIMVEFMKNKFPVLGINNKILKEIPSFLKFEHGEVPKNFNSLAELYSACGAVVHASALPFLSLLEFLHRTQNSFFYSIPDPST